MRIAILAHALRVAGGRVVGVNMLNALKKIDEKNVYFFIVPDQPEYRALNLDDGRHKVYYYRRRFGHLGRWFFDTFTLKRIVNHFQANVILGLGNIGLTNPPVPQAIWTMHPYLFYDLKNVGKIPLVFFMQILFLKWQFRRQLRKSGIVFCQTATIAMRLQERYPFKGKLVIIDNAISTFPSVKSSGVKTPPPLLPFKKKIKLFYLTRYYTHKGLEVIVELFDKYGSCLPNVMAVITIDSSHGKGAARLLNKIKKKNLGGRVLCVGPLAKEELPAYYSECDALLMPTRLESFSSAYLEAMHFGMPILTSDLDFAREVCGDAALYFDPLDPADIRDKVKRLLEEPGLGEGMKMRGKERLSSFSNTWGDNAQLVLNELESLANA